MRAYAVRLLRLRRIEFSVHTGIFYTIWGVGDWRFLGSNGATIVRGRAALLVNNGDMMRDAALAGLGIALLPMFYSGRRHKDWPLASRRRRSAT
jgi:DNA-binding transcriptional LysR family regulator